MEALGGTDTRGGPLDWHGTWMQPGLLLEGVWLDRKMSRMGEALLIAQTRLAAQEGRGEQEMTLCKDVQEEVRRLRARSTRALVAAAVALVPVLALLVGFALRALPDLGGGAPAAKRPSLTPSARRSCPRPGGHNSRQQSSEL